MPYENILLENRQKVQVLYINRPKVLNALNEKTLLEIEAAIIAFAQDQDRAVMIITGSGDRAFVAGADIEAQYPLDANQGRNWGLLGHRVFRLIETTEKPVIAAINGFALGGGCELAMACDIRLASEKARFGQPEVSLGITPGFGGTQRLPRLIGSGPAKELIYSGMNIDAHEAYRLGLVNHVYPAESLMDEARKLTQKIISNAPLAVSFCKASINKGLQTDIDTAMTIEADVFGLCFSTSDQKEGMNAFINKRKADFSGK